MILFNHNEGRGMRSGLFVRQQARVYESLRGDVVPVRCPINRTPIEGTSSAAMLPTCPLSPNLSHYVPRPYYRFALPPQQGPNTIGGSESLLHHFDFGSGGGGGGGTNLSRSSSVMIRHTAPSLSAKSSFHRRRVSRSTAPGLFSRCSEDSPPSFNIVPYQPN